MDKLSDAVIKGVSGGAGVLARTLPGMAAALGRGVRRTGAEGELRDTLDTRINDLDMAHLQAFSAEVKTQVMARVMNLTPLATDVCSDKHCYEKALMRLHDEGYGLIDLQPMETALTAVWYRKGKLPWSQRAEVAMLLWEQKVEGDTTTVMTWRI